MSKENNKHHGISNPKEAAQALEALFTTDFFDKKKLYWENFVRGMLFGAGGVIGATILIAVLLWVLSLFDTIPLIGPIVDNAKTTIQSSKN